MERKLGRYRIAFKLLETRDTEFLVKAGLCLVRTGPIEHDRVARMLETYSSIWYAKRVLSDPDASKKPTTDERRNYSYASQLYFSCLSDRDRASNARSQLVVDCFRCCLSSWGEDDLERALSLLDSNSRPCSDVILHLASFWTGAQCSCPSPMSFWLSNSGEHSKVSRRLRESMTNAARIACLQFHSKNNGDGLSRALSVISSRRERIQLLSTLGASAELFLRKCKWGSNHPAFTTNFVQLLKEPEIPLDETDLLVEELLEDDDLDSAAKMLVQRGLLLKAADCLEKKSETGSRDMAVSFKVLHLELVQGCDFGGGKSEDSDILKLNLT